MPADLRRTRRRVLAALGVATAVAAIFVTVGATTAAAATVEPPHPALIVTHGGAGACAPDSSTYSTIQAAVDVATSSSPPIYVCPGSYPENVQVPTSLVIDGPQYGVPADSGSARTEPAAEAYIDPPSGDDVDYVGQAKVNTLDGLTLLGGTDAVSGDNAPTNAKFTLQNDIIRDGSHAGFAAHPNGGYRSLVSHSRFTGAPNDDGSIVLQGGPTNDLDIAFNLFTADQVPINAVGGDDITDLSVIYNTNSGANDFVRLTHAHDSVIADNTIQNSHDAAVSIEGGDTGLQVGGNLISTSLSSPGVGVSVRDDGAGPNTATQIVGNSISGASVGIASQLGPNQTAPGFVTSDPAHPSRIQINRITGSTQNGIELADGSAAGVIMNLNTVDGSAATDCVDDTHSGGQHTANTWHNNVGGSASPAGLCGAFTAQSPPSAVLTNKAMSYTFHATSSPEPGYAYSVISGSLPDGLSLAADGTLSGAPTRPGTYSFAVEAGNANGSVDTPWISMVVSAGFTPVDPYRLLDTRRHLDPASSTLKPHASLILSVPRLPAGASAVVLNLTATGLTGAGSTFVSACPVAVPAPTCAKTSVLNVRSGQTIANEVTVPVGSDGQVRLYNGAGNLDLVADEVGFMSTAYDAVGPTRVYDTRHGNGAGPIAANTSRTFTVSGAPVGATAAVLNLTGVGLRGAGSTYLSACPSGEAVATCASTSSLNVSGPSPIANEITVPLGSGNTVQIYNGAGHVDAVADVAGFLSDGYTPLASTRVLDTRRGTGATRAKVGPNSSIVLTVPDLPAGTEAVRLNLTAVGLTGAGSTYVTACPATDTNAQCATTSTINVSGAAPLANEITVPVDSSGRIRLYNGAGHIDLVGDETGRFAT